MTDHSGRRELMAALGGAAASSILWPLAVRAQQPERTRRVAVLMAYAENDPEGQALLRTFATALEERGGKAGRNVLVDCRWGGGDIDRIRTFAKELVGLQPDVILANTTPVIAAFQRETRTIPIVFVVVSDPVGDGFVASLARPGGNITGFLHLEASIGGKWLEFLKEIAPQSRQAAIMSASALCTSLTALPMSGDSMAASASPFFTRSPSCATIFTTRPVTGEKT